MLACLAAPATASARGLPSTRLELGLSNGPDQIGWMKASGVPWKYRYQYLAGGVNTSGSWLRWQDASAPPGQFAMDYLSSSGAGGYLPVFIWYELLQSSPSSGSDEASRDLSNLANAGTMNAYYGSFKVLMQRAGSYGRPAVVLVEPDFWGYMQQRARALGSAAADAAPASVASSGFADVAGYANTVAGFGKALLHLRDVYSPNAIMAVDASPWASGVDVNASTDPGLDTVAEADKTATFLASTGSWDVVATDPDDHDAGWYVATGRTNAGFTHSWDATNARAPNFHRWEAWIGRIHTRLGLPAMAWQTPVGNSTLTNSCDQSTGTGHYRDNLVEYFLGHPGELTSAGLVAVLFGAGNACQTTPYNDGNVLRDLAREYYAGAPAVQPAAAPTPSAAPSPTPVAAPSAQPAPTPRSLTRTAATGPSAGRAGLVAAGLGALVVVVAGGAGIVLWRRGTLPRLLRR